MAKEVTIDDLAMMVQNGFKEVKDELKSEIKSVREDIQKVDDKVGSVRTELKEEMQEVKESIAFLSMKMVFQSEFTKLEKREKKFESLVIRLEKRVGVLEKEKQPA